MKKSEKKPARDKQPKIAQPKPKKNRKVLYTVLGSILAVALVTTGIIATVSYLNRSIADPILNTKPVQQITQLIKVQPTDNFTTMMIAPATETWWERLTQYTSQESIKAVDFTTIQKGAKYIAVVYTTGNSFGDFKLLGMPSVIIIYDEQETIVEHFEKVPYEQQRFVAGNMLVLSPYGAFSDIDYNLENLRDKETTITGNELQLGDEAKMIINGSRIAPLISKHYATTESETVISTTLNLFGINEKTTWVGTSKDGFTWDGQVENLRLTANTTREVLEYLYQQARILDPDTGQEIPITSIPAEERENSVFIDHQYGAINFMEIATREEAYGFIYPMDTPGEYKPNRLSEKIGETDDKEQGIYRVRINPNEWVDKMRDDDTLVFNTTNIDLITITVLDTQGNVRITVKPWDDEYHNSITG